MNDLQHKEIEAMKQKVDQIERRLEQEARSRKRISRMLIIILSIILGFACLLIVIGVLNFISAK